MAIWIQSLSWALIYSLAQGLVVFASLLLVLRVVPASSANARYHLSLSALTVLLAWFVATWWQQFHSLTLAGEQLQVAGTTGFVVLQLPLQQFPVSGSSNILQSLQTFFPWLTAFYIAGFVLMLVRLSFGMLQLFTLRTSGIYPPATPLSDLLEKQKKQLQLTTPVRLLISAKAQVPMVIGFLKPVILMPVAVVAQMDTCQLETILLHELAHIKRHDYLVNILQTIVETILFFNPFVWAISNITRREREHSCDDLVVNHTSEPVSYATALATLASGHTTTPRIAIAATGQQTHLFNRIQRIIEMKKNPFNYSRMVAALILIATITCSIAWVKPALPKVKKTKPTTASAVRPAKATPANAIPTTPKPIETKPAATDIKKDKETIKPVPAIKEPAIPQPALADQPEEKTLVDRLLTDRMVDQVKGFTVEKRANRLYINGLLISDEVAAKYLSGINKEEIRVKVFSLDDRMRMHPDASFIQLLLPATFSSPCIDTRPKKKDGC